MSLTCWPPSGTTPRPCSPSGRSEAKSNEIPAFTPLLSGLYLPGLVITADALHTQTEHARQIVAASGHFLFIVKANQPTLHHRLKALPWREALLNDRTDERGHGRREIRRMKICTTRPHLPFPMPPRPSRSNAAAPTSRPARPPSSRSTPSPACRRAVSPTPSSPR
ncbi:Mobile element protein [[Actinomadura] parvosata subsp. kistnae]|nr:Mobile element protein [Actinomadura parvosata subsp. kistnae]